MNQYQRPGAGTHPHSPHRGHPTGQRPYEGHQSAQVQGHPFGQSPHNGQRDQRGLRSGPIAHDEHRAGQSQYGNEFTGLHGGYGYDSSPSNLYTSSHQDNLMPVVLPNQQQVLNNPNPTPSKPGGFSLDKLASFANLNEIKGFVDRMGGLDGILSTVTKVQKVVSSVTQMAPLVKVFMGSFGKNSSAQAAPSNSNARPRNPGRRRTGTGSGNGRRTGTTRRRGQARRRR